MKLNLIQLLLIFIITIIFIMISLNCVESFGATSPGTLVQLASSHVATQEDLDYYTKVYPKQVRGEIARMTGGDPGNVALYPF
jgi:hypothetical protein